jgi:hypothetical protein
MERSRGGRGTNEPVWQVAKTVVLTQHSSAASVVIGIAASSIALSISVTFAESWRSVRACASASISGLRVDPNHAAARTDLILQRGEVQPGAAPDVEHHRARRQLEPANRRVAVRLACRGPCVVASGAGAVAPHRLLRPGSTSVQQPLRNFQGCQPTQQGDGPVAPFALRGGSAGGTVVIGSQASWTAPRSLRRPGASLAAGPSPRRLIRRRSK